MLSSFVKVKKSKNPRKTRIVQTPPTHPPILFILYFLNSCTTKITTQKNTIFEKKKNPSWGLTHPSTFEFFSDLKKKINLTKPLRFYSSILYT